MAKIAYATKVSNGGATSDGVFTSVNANEIKTSVNSLYDEIDLKPNSSLTTINVSEYSNNAAATTAGLGVGRVYRTGDLLKIVHL